MNVTRRRYKNIPPPNADRSVCFPFLFIFILFVNGMIPLNKLNIHTIKRTELVIAIDIDKNKQ